MQCSLWCPHLAIREGVYGEMNSFGVKAFIQLLSNIRYKINLVYNFTAGHLFVLPTFQFYI